MLHRRISFDLATLIESIVSQLGQFSLSLFVCTSTLLSALEHISTLLKMQTTTATARAQVPRLLWLGDRLRFTHTHSFAFYPALCAIFAFCFCLFFSDSFPLRANAFSLLLQCVCLCVFSLNLFFETSKWNRKVVVFSLLGGLVPDGGDQCSQTKSFLSLLRFAAKSFILILLYVFVMVSD